MSACSAPPAALDEFEPDGGGDDNDDDDEDDDEGETE